MLGRRVELDGAGLFRRDLAAPDWSRAGLAGVITPRCSAGQICWPLMARLGRRWRIQIRRLEQSVVKVVRRWVDGAGGANWGRSASRLDAGRRRLGEQLEAEDMLTMELLGEPARVGGRAGGGTRWGTRRGGGRSRRRRPAPRT
jgi:hypothetical protein